MLAGDRCGTLVVLGGTAKTVASDNTGLSSGE